MKLIPLTQGLFAKVDDADYDAVMQFKWYADKRGRRFYAARKVRKPDGKQTTQGMHQFLFPGVAEVHHINGDGLNNSREKNLRPATHRQNMQGFQRKRLGASSKLRGVTQLKDGKWQAAIKVNGKGIYLGRFVNENDAARAYDSAAVFYFGDRASTNFPIGEITIT